MNFKVDENLPVEIAELFRSSGHSAHTVSDEDLTGATDAALRAVCQKEMRHFVTRDLDFADVRELGSECGFLILRSTSADKLTCIRLIEQYVQQLSNMNLSGKIVIIEAHSLRVRER
jgi:predicted nuclease of predicted toxin-antitoxin system